MRTFGKWLGRVLLALLLAAVAVGIWKRDEIFRLLAVNSLFEADRIVANFSNMEGAFLTVPIPVGTGVATALPQGAPLTLPEGANRWIETADVTSLLVMKDGAVVFEEYYLGTGEMDQRISWSLAKSYLSALFGILVAEGAISSLDDPVTRYVPRLEGTAYDAATVRNVLQMSSGVVFDEDYLDPSSDINRMGRVLALGGLMDDFAAGLTDTDSEPGTRWRYVSIDTHILGMVIRGATGRSVADLLGEKILTPLGLEGTPYYITDGAGVAFVLGGLNSTTRDYARFAQMIANNGSWQGQQIVPADWIAESTRASAKTEPGRIGYGYQWWIPVGGWEGEFTGRGIYGQYLYIDQTRDVVIVLTGADREFRERGVHRANIEMMRAIARTMD